MAGSLRSRTRRRAPSIGAIPNRPTSRPPSPRPGAGTCFAWARIDLSGLRKVEFKFGGARMPPTGSIELADVRFQEAIAGPTDYTDKLADVAPTAAAAPTSEVTAPVAPSRPSQPLRAQPRRQRLRGRQR